MKNCYTFALFVVRERAFLFHLNVAAGGLPSVGEFTATLIEEEESKDYEIDDETYSRNIVAAFEEHDSDVKEL